MSVGARPRPRRNLAASPPARAEGDLPIESTYKGVLWDGTPSEFVIRSRDELADFIVAIATSRPELAPGARRVTRWIDRDDPFTTGGAGDRIDFSHHSLVVKAGRFRIRRVTRRSDGVHVEVAADPTEHHDRAYHAVVVPRVGRTERVVFAHDATEVVFARSAATDATRPHAFSHSHAAGKRRSAFAVESVEETDEDADEPADV